ncbi:MAG: hypothetical protein Q9172_000295 [Xanthocarpia lactea]
MSCIAPRIRIQGVVPTTARQGPTKSEVPVEQANHRRPPESLLLGLQVQMKVPPQHASDHHRSSRGRRRSKRLMNKQERRKHLPISSSLKQEEVAAALPLSSTQEEDTVSRRARRQRVRDTSTEGSDIIPHMTLLEADLQSTLQKINTVYRAYIWEHIWAPIAEEYGFDWEFAELVLTEQGGLNQLLKSKKVLYDEERHHFANGGTLFSASALHRQIKKEKRSEDMCA